MASYALASLKGGVGKTTTALHLAHELAAVRGEKTLLIDSDPNRMAMTQAELAEEGNRAFPFDVVTETQAPTVIGNAEPRYVNTVMDTKGGLERVHIVDIAEIADVLVVPAPPEFMAVDRMMAVWQICQGVESKCRFTAVLTMIPHSTTDGADCRSDLEEVGVPILRSDIPRSPYFAKASGEGAFIGQYLGAPKSRRDELMALYSAVSQEIIELSRDHG